MTEKRRQEIYRSVFSTMIVYNAASLPLDVKQLCRNMGIELLPLSEITANAGLTEDEVFDIRGNKDGCANSYKDHKVIAYNDSQIEGRIRFTICEEIFHFVLGHTEDPRFCIFSQKYDESTYQTYEEEARTGAGLILCQPQYFFANPDKLSPNNLEQLCGITGKCAVVRYDILTKFQASICKNPLFNQLPMPKVKGTTLKEFEHFSGQSLSWDSVIGL